MHHFKLCMQNYAPLCTILQLLVHGEPFGSLVQNNAIGFFLMLLTHGQPYCTVYKDRVDTIIL